MIAILLYLLLQGGTPMGAVTGTVRSAAGAPTAGVRVYAQQVRDTADANSPAPLEGLVQTDASGRYRLELPPGRYYVASGSVSAPTYYPGTTNVASAKLITVTAGGMTEGIDFGSFVPASSRSTGIAVSITLPLAVGAFSGTVRFPDGTPAANARVGAIPAVLNVPTAAVVLSFIPTGFRMTQTDKDGRYVIGNVPLGEYHVVAGYAETAAFFTDQNAQPRPIKLGSATTINSLDIDLLISPTRTGVPVSGTVVTNDGLPAAGSLVQIARARAFAAPMPALPSINEIPDTTVAGDGTFTFANVVPGSYTVQASFSMANKVEAIEVQSNPVTNLKFSLPIFMLAGRLVLEDGSAVPDPELFVSGVLSSTSNPNLILSTLLPFSAGGVFAGVPDKGESRFYFRNVPEEYEIRSITAGAVDLVKEPLKFDGTQSVVVEARVARRGSSSSGSSVRITGVVRDGSGATPAASRVELCCLDRNFMNALSAPIRPDGSFEFSGVPSGKYTPELRVGAGHDTIRIMSATIERTSGLIKLQMVSGTSATIPVIIDVPTGP
jgi:hypothetical protein